MRYLLANHVLMGRGVDGKVVIGDLFLADLKAQAKAIEKAGGRLVVATPMVEQLEAGAGGSFGAVEVWPEECGFDYVPLPPYRSMKSYLQVRRELAARLKEAVARADVVQADYGGHPIPLGQIVWPIAGAMKKKRIWVFDGADPFPRLAREARNEKNPIKRLARLMAMQQFERFCRRAIKEADLVFAHNAAVMQRFAKVWNERCYLFDRTFVTEEVLITRAELETRMQRIRAGNNPLKMVAAGRQIAIKGTDHVLRAMAKAKERGTTVELEVIGEGENLENFKKLASELGLTGAVKFHGAVPYGNELFKTWDKAQVMAITNLTAEISRNVMLGMGRGLALLLYRNAGTDRLIEQTGAGMLVPTGDVEALATAIVKLAGNREQIAEMVTKGWEAASERTLEECHRRRAELAVGVIGVKGQRSSVNGQESKTIALSPPPWQRARVKASSSSRGMGASPMSPSPLQSTLSQETGNYSRCSLMVIIVNYRTGGMVVDCLRSLATQVSAGMKVVVADNASEDGSAKLIRDAIERNSWGEWCQVKELERNGGFAYGNNRVIEEAIKAGVEFVMLLNPDTVVRPGGIRELTEFMKDRPKVGIAGSRLEEPDGKAQRSAFRFPGVMSELEAGMRLGVVSKILARWIVAPPVSEEACRTDWVAGAGMMIRREVFEKIGLFDEGYFMYFEEVDFCARAAAAGFECWYAPRSRVVHLVGQASGVTDPRRRQRRPGYWFESRRRYFVKHYGKARTALADAAWAASYAMWRVRRMLQGRPDEDPPKLLGDFVRHSAWGRRGQD